MDKFVKECFVNDVLHYQALEIWKNIEVGDKVKLTSDNVQLKDKNQKLEERVKSLEEDIRILKEGPRSEEVKVISKEKKVIGYLSKDDSKLLVDIINCRPEDDIFYGLISAVEEKNEEDKRIKVAIFIEKK